MFFLQTTCASGYAGSRGEVTCVKDLVGSTPERSRLCFPRRQSDRCGVQVNWWRWLAWRAAYEHGKCAGGKPFRHAELRERMTPQHQLLYFLPVSQQLHHFCTFHVILIEISIFNSPLLFYFNKCICFTSSSPYCSPLAQQRAITYARPHQPSCQLSALPITLSGVGLLLTSSAAVTGS